MLNTIYTIKACMLLMYSRLTFQHTQQRLVIYLSVYVLIGWIATETAFFTACRPFYGYWAMPPPDPQCTTLQHYSIVQASFNISSDALMLCVPLPLITRLRMPWKQKIVLAAIFSMGIFVIVAAILTKVFNLMDVYDTAYMLWYTREASVAVYVANLPMIWPLMREVFPCLQTLTSAKGKGTSSLKGRNYANGTGGGLGGSVAISSQKKGDGSRIVTTVRTNADSDDDLELGVHDTEMAMRDLSPGAISRQDSEERLRPSTGKKSSESGFGGHGHKDRREHGDGGIYVGTTVEVSEEVVQAPQASYASRTARYGIPSGIADEEKAAAGGGGFDWGFEKGRR